MLVAALAIVGCSADRSPHELKRVTVQTRSGIVYSFVVESDCAHAYIITSEFGRSKFGFYEDKSHGRNDSMVLTSARRYS